MGHINVCLFVCLSVTIFWTSGFFPTGLWDTTLKYGPDRSTITMLSSAKTTKKWWPFWDCDCVILFFSKFTGKKRKLTTVLHYVLPATDQFLCVSGIDLYPRCVSGVYRLNKRLQSNDCPRHEIKKNIDVSFLGTIDSFLLCLPSFEGFFFSLNTSVLALFQMKTYYRSASKEVF